MSSSHTLGQRADDARQFLAKHGLWRDGGGSGPLVLVSDADISGALTVPDIGVWLGPTWSGRMGVLFGAIEGRSTGADDDLITHELVHVWLRRAGANEPRVVVRDGHADLEASIIQEGLADFIAAARSGDAIVGRRTNPRAASLEASVRCPDAHTGQAHADGIVLASALWKAHRVLGTDQVLAAIAKAAPGHTHHIADLSRSLGRVFGEQSPEAARAWSEIETQTGLLRCDEPIVLEPGVVRSAYRGDFVIPATASLATGAKTGGRPNPALAEGARRQGESVGAPQHFEFAVPFSPAHAVLSLRVVAPREALSVVWQAVGVDVSGRSVLEGGPRVVAQIDIPSGATGLVFRLVSSAPEEVAYADLMVKLEPAATASHVALADTTAKVGFAAQGPPGGSPTSGRSGTVTISGTSATTGRDTGGCAGTLALGPGVLDVGLVLALLVARVRGRHLGNRVTRSPR